MSVVGDVAPVRLVTGPVARHRQSSATVGTRVRRVLGPGDLRTGSVLPPAPPLLLGVTDSVRGQCSVVT